MDKKNIIYGTLLLSAILIASYFRLFGYAGIWGYYVQLIGYAIASGQLTTVVTVAILDKLSPVFKYWVQGKTMKYILIVILAFEFVMMFAFGLDITLRTIVVWLFIPLYQILSKIRNIPMGEVMDEKMDVLNKISENGGLK